MDHVITRVPGAKICMTNQGIKRIPLTNADDSGGHWVTTDDGNRLFITDGGEVKTGPEGKTVDYTKDSPAGQLKEQYKSGSHMPETTYSRESAPKESPVSVGITKEREDFGTGSFISDAARGREYVSSELDKYTWAGTPSEKIPDGPKGIISVNPDGKMRLSVMQAYSVKDDLKSQGYRFDSTTKDWSKSFTSASDLAAEKDRLSSSLKIPTKLNSGFNSEHASSVMPEWKDSASKRSWFESTKGQGQKGIIGDRIEKFAGQFGVKKE